MNTTIRYLYHSGFMVFNSQTILVFDYFQGQINWPEAEQIYVFSSHSHPDHFNPAILDWQAERPEIKYIFSSDIQTAQEPKHAYYMEPYEELNIDNLNIKTFGSTDLGVSFYVTVRGSDGEEVNIFHAGDLNWWHWYEDTPENIKAAELLFKQEMDRLGKLAIDIAFFPVDSRLQHFCGLGADYFITRLKPHYFIPMHFCEDINLIEKFTAGLSSPDTQAVLLTRPGQEFRLG